MERFVCVHGHFYQPPRENPWLERVELQDSAYPYHDWNERITAECYAPNATSRILDDEAFVVKIVNNYARISFNFGPTLLAWFEQQAPDVLDALVSADRQSKKTFSGHGSALAQAYNHMIMPLANDRDKRTQVVWGIADFKHRFGRAPEGMWLPETAVDLATLDILAGHGIAFTILAPHQAKRVRRPGASNWHDVSGGRIDPRRAYRVKLPSGRTMSLFFYDGPVSQAVAFDGLLRSGDVLAERLTSVFSDDGSGVQLSHIATDGETYGHHHRHGDMALAYALDNIDARSDVRLTNYAEFLELHPPEHEVEIFENTSWSCAHGIERWRSDCGCNTGGQPGWNQAWRAPLREALDWLRDELAPLYEDCARPLLRDPWAARDDYVSVVLDRSPENIDRFFDRHQARDLSQDDRVRALKLLEMQRHAMLMYTSCGWFFSELSGIETVQVIHYAGRAIQLAQQLVARDIEGPFLQRLDRARSNIPEHGDGHRIYEKFVRPAMVDLAKVCAHYAAMSLFQPYEEDDRVYSYRVQRLEYASEESGRARLAVGRARVTSEITWESDDLEFALIHFGDQNLHGGVREYLAPERYQSMAGRLEEAFRGGDFAASIHTLDEHFGDSTFSLRSLFRDEQRTVIDEILSLSLVEAEAAYRTLHEHHAPLMNFLVELGIPVPKPFALAAEVALNTDLRALFAQDEPDIDRAKALVEEARQRHVELDAEGLAFTLKRTLERMAERAGKRKLTLQTIDRLARLIALARSLPFEVDIAKVQNSYYDLLVRQYPRVRARAQNGDERAARVAERFRALGDQLRVRVDG
jgi:alpha-amylase/alpha-mannosidase (GH57 family)